MKYAIVGSRQYDDYEAFSRLVSCFKKDIDMIISGGAIGVDTMAYRYAIEHGITFVCHPPKPEEPYPARFFRRNLRIVEQAEIIMAFPTINSRGTRHAIDMAKKLGKKIIVFER